MLSRGIDMLPCSTSCRFQPSTQVHTLTHIMKLGHCRFLASAAALSAALAAQSLTITDGNMSMTTGALSSSSQSPCGFALAADALGTNHAYEHWWYYRVAGDTRENALRAIGPVSGGVTPFLTHADRDLADVDLRGILRASVDFDVYDSGPASGVVVSRLTLTNTSNAALTLDLFSYQDLDISGTYGDDVVTGNGTHHVVTDWTGVQIDVRAPGADHSDIGAYPSVRTLLTNTSVDNLTDTLPPFNGDYTGAFQWSNRTLQPGEQRSFSVVFAVDTAASRVPEVEHYGRGSTLVPEIYTDTLPLQDNSQLRQLGIHLRNALPNSPVGLLSNTTPANGLPFLNCELWVDPNPPMQFPIGVTTAAGEMSSVFIIPPSPYVTGFPIYHQYFYADNQAPNGVGQWTPAILTRVGRL